MVSCEQILQAPPALMARYWNSDGEILADQGGHALRADGIFVATSCPPMPGTLLQFEIFVDGEDPPLSGVARVLASQELGEGGAARPSGVAVRFIYFDEPEKGREVLARIRSKDEAKASAPEPLELDHGFFSAPPHSTRRVPLTFDEELGIVDARAVREADPRYHARRRRLRRVVLGVLAGAVGIGAIAAQRGAVPTSRAAAVENVVTPPPAALTREPPPPSATAAAEPVSSVTELGAEPPKASDVPLREDDPYGAAPVKDDPYGAAPVKDDPYGAAPVKDDLYSAAPVKDDPYGAAPVKPARAKKKPGGDPYE